jgi:hypothetical protein
MRKLIIYIGSKLPLFSLSTGLYAEKIWNITFSHHYEWQLNKDTRERELIHVYRFYWFKWMKALSFLDRK